MRASNQLFLLVFSAFLLGFAVIASAEDVQGFDASGDYIKDCKYATCVGIAGSEWSENNPFGVAVAVSMGTKPAVTDDQIKMVLSQDLKYYGVDQIKFFYERNDVPASVMTLHVRGGTEGPFNISNVREHIQGVSDRAKNTNPATITGR